MQPPRPRPLALTVALAGLGVILALTLVPGSGPDTGTFQWCLGCGTYALSDAIGNVGLFIPAAIGVHRSGVRAWKTVALLVLLSAAIEIAQLWIPGRESALADILANGGGAALGAALSRWFPGRRRSWRSAIAACAGALAVMAGTALALQPSLPATPYYGQWTADLGNYAWYRGRVLSAEMDGMQLPSWRLDDSRRARVGLLAGEPLLIRAIAGPRPDRVAPIFSIYDAERQEILLVGADRDDLVLHVRARATDALLRQPELRWPLAMAGVGPGDTLVIGVRRAGTGYCLSLERAGERCGLAFTLGETWALVQFSPRLPRAAEAALDCLVMAALAFAVGVLAPRRRWTLVVVAAVVAAVLLLPSLLDVGPTPPLQVAALLAGAVLGVLTPERREATHAPLDASEA